MSVDRPDSKVFNYKTVQDMVDPLSQAFEDAQDKALDKQYGGKHYKMLKIQPIEYIMANDLSYTQGNVIKYVTRYKEKNGIEDLKKAKHYIDFMIEELDNETK